MNPIRVLHVIKTLALGGAETNLFNLVQATNPCRVESHVAYSFGGEIESRFRNGNVRLFKFSDQSHRIKSPATALIVLRLARYILENGIDIVHTHVFNAHVWGALAAKLTGRKLLEHVHDFRYVEPKTRREGRCHTDQYRYAAKMASFSDGVIVLTTQNRDFVLERGLCPPGKVWLIRNGIPVEWPDVTRNGDLRLRFHLPTDRKIFLTPARLSSEKNIDLLFQIIPRVARECPDVVFVVAGDGPLLEIYQKRAEDERFTDHLKFIGFCPNIRELLRVTDALVLPSFLELHPISVLEALSMRVPVIVSEGVGCHSEIFTHGKNAVLLDPHSPEEWAETLIALARDPELGRAIGERGYRLCQRKFDIRETASQIEKTYQRLLGEAAEDESWTKTESISAASRSIT